jgi:diguanylate cyclase (GGDEF)-like protein
MKFPQVEDIATREVVSVDEQTSLQTAVAAMMARGIRDLVVRSASNNEYGIVTVTDIIRARMRRLSMDTTLQAIGYRRPPVVVVGTNILHILGNRFAEASYLIVTDADGALFGIISESDIIAHIDPKMLIEQQRVGDIIGKHRIKTCSSDLPLATVLAELVEVDDAVVLTAHALPLGIITTKDAVRLIHDGADFAAPAADYMTAPLQTVSEDITVREALESLQHMHFKRLVVAARDGTLLGVISQHDLIDNAYAKWAEMLREHADELSELVRLLETKALRLARIAETDKLTGCYNRSKFDAALAQEIGRFNRYEGKPFSVAFFDVDYFKGINDEYGHLCGDEVLKHCVRLIQKRVRDVDLFARWGGEEFVLLMPNTSAENAFQQAERIRAYIEAAEFPGPGRVTMSVGVAAYRKDELPEHFVHRVDKALYRAKLGGRNRVEVAD